MRLGGAAVLVVASLDRTLWSKFSVSLVDRHGFTPVVVEPGFSGRKISAVIMDEDFTFEGDLAQLAEAVEKDVVRPIEPSAPRRKSKGERKRSPWRLR